MANPNWPSFPGVPNMSLDGDGRPQAQDLIPGKQLGTPLNAAFFNPILGKVCDLSDQIDAENNAAISGTLDLAPGDHQGLGLHTQGGSNAVLYNDGVNGWRPLALNADLQAESQRAQAAESQLVLGTKGLDDYSLKVTGIKSQYSDTSKNNPIGIEYMDDAGVFQLAITRDFADTLYASQSALQAETQRAQTAEGQLVLGTQGVDDYSLRITGIKSQYSDTAKKNPVGIEYMDDAGLYQLAITRDYADTLYASRSDLQNAASQAVSGTLGLASGDQPGIGLHTQGGSNAVLYNDSANGWRYLVVGEGNNTDGAVRAAVFSAGANGDRSSPTFIDGDGHYIGLLPAQNPVVNGALKTDTIASASGAAVSVSYDGGGRVAFQNDGNFVGYSSSGGVNFALGSSSCTLNGPLMINNNGGSLGLNPNTTFNGQMRGQISWGGRSWYPGGDGLIMVDNGNILAEAISPTLTYRFTLQVVHGSRLVWPRQFADDNVQIAGMAKDGSTDNVHILNLFSVDRYGAVVSLNVWNGSGLINETASTTATFIVTGSPL
ncbi:hypothetical protein [Saccharibacter floricola]|uniref:Tail fiber protein n=1 Tax=Saccharibacter floricola DSM 15669 TaxID=1123227 RepID=A0ABQ0P1E1_9PROT|nr:hypothetical protein [Saccharibacter floricola]GBQ08963.1 hypothetical protein AA15669_1987 [Saccharibacter floricola DSM 15669]